jgi:sporulation protein YlmC with PRC-barrel domain
MNRIQKLVCVGLAPACLISVAAAMSSARCDEPQQPQKNDTTQSHPTDAHTHAKADKDMKDMKNGPVICMSNDLIGTKVVSTSGDKLGKIEDLVINPNGEIAYGVLSFGGFLGMGDKYFAVPWNVLRSDVPKATSKETRSSEREFVLPIDKERLKNAPGFDKSHWPAMVESDWAKDVDAFYGASHSDSARTVEASASKNAGPIWKASELKGFNVNSTTGDKLGDIKDLAIDTNGHLSYAVVSVGGFLGMGDKLVAVPWPALKVSRDASNDKRTILLSSTKDQLKNAPAFDDSKDKRAEMCDPAWVSRVYEYYSVRPYWPHSEGE